MIKFQPAEEYARVKGMSERDALQTFMQVVVLKHLSLPGARLIGGTALVLGHGNPRFSEDIDLTQVPDVRMLGAGLKKGVLELEQWIGKKVILQAPRGTGRTWRLVCPLSRSETVSLHVDSQDQPALTSAPIVIQFPSLEPIVFETSSPHEIMADKVVALAERKYLGGRDLFDLWFHWLRKDDWQDFAPEIRNYYNQKIGGRKLDHAIVHQRLSERLMAPTSLARAESEWKRYLPPAFQRKDILDGIINACQKIPGIFI